VLLELVVVEPDEFIVPEFVDDAPVEPVVVLPDELMPEDVVVALVLSVVPVVVVS
jgi:hypothetical protein